MGDAERIGADGGQAQIWASRPVSPRQDKCPPPPGLHGRIDLRTTRRVEHMDRLFWAIFCGVALVWIILLLVLPNVSAFDIGAVAVPFGLVVVWKLLGDRSRRQPVTQPVAPLDDSEKRSIRRWGKLDHLLFVGSLLLIAAALLLSALFEILYFPWPWATTATVVLAVMLPLHFSGRCPRCGHRVGYDRTLGLAKCCGRCGVQFKGGPVWQPDAPRS